MWSPGELREANRMIMSDVEDAQKILSILLQGFNAEEKTEEMTELKLSAIKEIGNILGSSYINAIATLTGLQINLSVPYIAIDMAGAIMSVPIIEFGSVGDKIMFIEEVFSGRENDLRSNVIMFAQIETLKLIMERLGLNL